ncbi:MAG: hypothetical protein K2X41_00480 [Hyphomicrobium sp.]|nr:hypothetical protein [Hyphomicrobium sp.]
MKIQLMQRLVLSVVLLVSTAAEAHIVPWRDGESRQIGYGHCAKGACTKRYSFAETKPHQHVNGRAIFLDIAPGYPASRGWWR